MKNEDPSLNQYMESYGITRDKLAQKLNIQLRSLYGYLAKSGEPSLLVALKIHDFCEGEVTLEQLLKPKNLEELKEWRSNRLK